MKSVTSRLIIPLIATAFVWAGGSAAADSTRVAGTAADTAAPYWPAAKRDGIEDRQARPRHEPLGAMWTVADEPEDVVAAKTASRRKGSSCKRQKVCNEERAGQAAKPTGRKTVPQKTALASAPEKIQVKAAVAPPRPPAPAPVKAAVAQGRPQMPAANMADQIILADVTRACTARDANACLMLGRMYATGTVTAKDPAAALKTFRLSCDLGSGAACFTLGQMHEKGTGAAASVSEAARYYQLACRRGNDPACKNVVRLSAKAPAFRIQDLFAPKKPVS